jgi:hypothetical protein
MYKIMNDFVVLNADEQEIWEIPFFASSYEGYGCMNVEIKGKSLSVEYYSDTNHTIDKFMITKKPFHSDVDEKNEVQRIGYDEPTK